MAEPKLTLHLNRAAGLPLYTQLRDELAAWLRQQPPGSRVPSERQLAEALDVNRRTLHRAVEELEARGLLERRGRRLFVHHPAEEMPAELVPHTFVSQTVDPGAVDQTTLRFAIYENLPWQRACWTAIQAMFNQENPDLHLELDLVPMSVNTDSRYLDYLQQHGCDLLLAPQTMVSAKNHTHLRPLGPEVCQLLRGHDDLLPSLLTGDEGKSFFAAPLHMCIWPCLINTDLLPAEDLPQPIDALGLLRWLAAHQDRLPPGKDLFAVPSEFLNVLGHVPVPMSRSQMQDFVQLHIDLLQAVMPMSDRIRNLTSAPGETSHVEAARAFADGDMAVYLGPSYYVLGLLKPSQSNWELVDLRLPRDHRCGIASTCVSITGNCQNEAAANRVIEFLLSPPAQREIARAGVNCPAHRSGRDALAAYMTPRAPERLDHLTDTYFMRTALNESFDAYARHMLWPRLIKPIMDGGADMEQVCRDVVEQVKRDRSDFLT